MAACARAGTMPESFTFAFGTEYTLEKSQTRVTIAFQPAWGDAQRPPDAGFGEVQAHTVQIPAAAAQALWDRIAALDPRPYQQPAAANFDPTPPDMRHTESLNWIVNGQTVAAWSQGYKFLKPDLRRPLALVADAIRAAYEKAAAQ
jgi:hypothetical protein